MSNKELNHINFSDKQCCNPLLPYYLVTSRGTDYRKKVYTNRLQVCNRPIIQHTDQALFRQPAKS